MGAICKGTITESRLERFTNLNCVRIFRNDFFIAKTNSLFSTTYKCNCGEKEIAILDYVRMERVSCKSYMKAMNINIFDNVRIYDAEVCVPDLLVLNALTKISSKISFGSDVLASMKAFVGHDKFLEIRNCFCRIESISCFHVSLLDRSMSIRAIIIKTKVIVLHEGSTVAREHDLLSNKNKIIHDLICMNFAVPKTKEDALMHAVEVCSFVETYCHN